MKQPKVLTIIAHMISIILLVLPTKGYSGEAQDGLGDCDGDQLKDRKSLPKDCRNCVPLVVEGIIRCLPFFMPGDIGSAVNTPLNDGYEAVLGRDVTLMGFTWPKGTKLIMQGWTSGNIEIIEFPKVTKLKGFPVLRLLLWSFDSIHINSFDLPVDHAYGGYLWPKGSGLSFHFDSKEIPKLWYVVLGEDSMFDGKKYKKRDYLWFNKEGKIDLTAPAPKPIAR